jgi:hypothetical protein
MVLQKLGIARREGQRRTIKQSDVVFSSAKEATQQVRWQHQGIPAWQQLCVCMCAYQRA